MTEEVKSWRCFHCDEVFLTRADAQQHFSMDGIPPMCVDPLTKDEKARMTVVRKLEATCRRLMAENEELDHQAGALSAMRQELARYFGTCGGGPVQTASQAWLVHEAVIGRAEAAEQRAEQAEADLAEMRNQMEKLQASSAERHLADIDALSKADAEAKGLREWRENIQAQEAALEKYRKPGCSHHVSVFVGDPVEIYVCAECWAIESEAALAKASEELGKAMAGKSTAERITGIRETQMATWKSRAMDAESRLPAMEGVIFRTRGHCLSMKSWAGLNPTAEQFYAVIKNILDDIASLPAPESVPGCDHAWVLTVDYGDGDKRRQCSLCQKQESVPRESGKEGK